MSLLNRCTDFGPFFLLFHEATREPVDISSGARLASFVVAEAKEPARFERSDGDWQAAEAVSFVVKKPAQEESFKYIRYHCRLCP